MKEFSVMTVTSCYDCPFCYDDSDYGMLCHHGVKIGDIKKQDEIHVRHGVGGCVYSSIPKKCPLFKNTFTVELSDIYTKTQGDGDTHQK